MDIPLRNWKNRITFGGCDNRFLMAFHFRPPILFCILQTFNLESTIDSDNVSETATVQSVKLHATVRMHKTPKFVNYII